MKRRTKIVCTLGPSVDSREKISALIDAGMNVARINCSHGDWETRFKWIKWVRELSPEIAPVGILVDLQGPKFRIGTLVTDPLELTAGQMVEIGEDAADIPITQDEIIKALTAGARVLLGDGEIELRVSSVSGKKAQAKVISGGPLRSRKGITLVGKVFDSPAMTEKDKEDIREAAKAQVEYIALSYVCDASDLRELRHYVDKFDRNVSICAKIETREATKDLDHILKVVDIVMVARGDMGLQMDLEEVPAMQKHIIERCTIEGKPVITATQMLESMIINPRPTRAEATDVFNAILDGTDAVMLSGETAAGAYPIECVKTMNRIAERAEAEYDYDRFEREFFERARGGISNSDAIAHAVSDITRLMKPAAIITSTTSGQTPRLVSKFRPRSPILCATWNPRTHAKMAVVWGVDSLLIALPESTDEIMENAVNALMRKKRLKLGDLVVITAGVPAGTAGNTNMIVMQTLK